MRFLLLASLAVSLAACTADSPPDAQAAASEPASDYADRQAIEDLVHSYAYAALRADADAFASLWTEDGTWTIGEPMGMEFASRDSIVAGFSGLMSDWEFLIQTPQYGFVDIDGDTATGRWLVREVGRKNDGTGQHNDALYVDRYVRTPDGWRVAARDYQVVRIDAEPVAGDYLGVQP